MLIGNTAVKSCFCLNVYRCKDQHQQTFKQALLYTSLQLYIPIHRVHPIRHTYSNGMFLLSMFTYGFVLEETRWAFLSL